MSSRLCFPASFFLPVCEILSPRSQRVFSHFHPGDRRLENGHNLRYRLGRKCAWRSKRTRAIVLIPRRARPFTSGSVEEPSFTIIFSGSTSIILLFAYIDGISPTQDMSRRRPYGPKISLPSCCGQRTYQPMPRCTKINSQFRKVDALPPSKTAVPVLTDLTLVHRTPPVLSYV